MERGEGGEGIEESITISAVQGRRKKTTIEGLSALYDAQLILRFFRKEFNCSGTAEGGRIQLMGDHRERARDFFVEEGIAARENVKMTGRGE